MAQLTKVVTHLNARKDLTESGGGIYEDNRIHNIRGSGIFVSADCSPVLANNHGTV